MGWGALGCSNLTASGARGRVAKDVTVFNFFFCGLEGRGPCNLKRLLGFSFLGGIGFDLSPEVGILLP